MITSVSLVSLQTLLTDATAGVCCRPQLVRLTLSSLHELSDWNRHRDGIAIGRDSFAMSQCVGADWVVREIEIQNDLIALNLA